MKLDQHNNKTLNKIPNLIAFVWWPQTNRHVHIRKINKKCDSYDCYSWRWTKTSKEATKAQVQILILIIFFDAYPLLYCCLYSFSKKNKKCNFLKTAQKSVTNLFNKHIVSTGKCSWFETFRLMKLIERVLAVFGIRTVVASHCSRRIWWRCSVEWPIERRRVAWTKQIQSRVQQNVVQHLKPFQFKSKLLSTNNNNQVELRQYTTIKTKHVLGRCFILGTNNHIVK